MKRLIVITGPTGVGKTRVAIEVATALGCEIVSADSRQVYRGIPIGTAAPTADERARVCHHLVDFLSISKKRARKIDKLLADDALIFCP